MTERTKAIAETISIAGGEVVGRTRLQKIFYMFEIAGYSSGFRFGYKHYGPYSEELKLALQLSVLLGVVDEKQEISKTGHRYSVYSSNECFSVGKLTPKEEMLSIMQKATSIELELAATAVLLSRDGFEENPWEETKRRKPEKAADGRLIKAKALLKEISAVQTPNPIPPLSA